MLLVPFNSAFFLAAGDRGAETSNRNYVLGVARQVAVRKAP